MHEYNSFLSLTYDDEHLPEDGSLNVEHWQYFAKRVRKWIAKRKSKEVFRYFHAGEYGEEKFRPHYHAAVFGLDWSADRYFWKTSKTGYPIYRSPMLEELWGMGTVYIGNLSFESAAYVARYIMKKVNGEEAIPHYGHLKPEYVTMSRKPGIGKKWIDKYLSDVYPSDQVIINGKASQPPKFYDKQLQELKPEIHAIIKAARRKAENQHLEDKTPDRLEERENVLKARIGQLKREM